VKNSLLTVSGTTFSSKNLEENKDILSKELYAFYKLWFNNSDTIVLKTSGSTGQPKKIRASKTKMFLSALKTGAFLDLKTGDKALCCLPLTFIAGKMMVVRSIALNLNLTVVKPSKNPFKGLNENFKFSACTSYQLENSIDNLKNIDTLLVGGSPINEDTKEKLGNIKTTVYETFGMTETLSHVALKNLSNLESSFKALEGYSFEKVNGCLKIHSKDILEASLLTNDIVTLISKKEFIWQGRKDFVINSGGIKLFPETIEKSLSKFFKASFIIMGVPDRSLGEKVIIIFEKSLPSNYDKAINSLSTYEKPKSFLVLDKFSRNNNKLLRKEIINEVLSKWKTAQK